MRGFLFMRHRCNKCKRALHEEMEKFEEQHVNFGVVEKKDECKECEYVDGSNLQYCIECGNLIEN